MFVVNHNYFKPKSRVVLNKKKQWTLICNKSTWCQTSHRSRNSSTVPHHLTVPVVVTVAPLHQHHHHHLHHLLLSEIESPHPVGTKYHRFWLMTLNAQIWMQFDVLPSGCDSSGYPSKRPPDSCWASAWPLLCKETAPGSSLGLVHDWSSWYPGEAEYQHNTTRLP